MFCDQFDDCTCTWGLRQGLPGAEILLLLVVPLVKVARHFIGVGCGGCPDIGWRRWGEGLSVKYLHRVS